jgi:hypothetical protein
VVEVDLLGGEQDVVAVQGGDRLQVGAQVPRAVVPQVGDSRPGRRATKPETSARMTFDSPVTGSGWGRDEIG